MTEPSETPRTPEQYRDLIAQAIVFSGIADDASGEAIRKAFEPVLGIVRAAMEQAWEMCIEEGVRAGHIDPISADALTELSPFTALPSPTRQPE